MKLNLAPIVVSTVSASVPIPTDSRTNANDQGITVPCVCAGAGPFAYQVQATMDDVYAAGWNPATANWMNFGASQTTTAQVNATVPATAVRVNVTSVTGTITITAWQASAVGF